MTSHSRLPFSQSAHDDKIRELATQLKTSGYSVEADHVDGFTRPPVVCGHIPDIVAMRGDEMILVEVESECSYDSTEARFERIAFSGYAAIDSDNRLFKTIMV